MGLGSTETNRFDTVATISEIHNRTADAGTQRRFKTLFGVSPQVARKARSASGGEPWCTPFLAYGY